MLVKEMAARSGLSKRTIDNYLRENGSIPSAEAAVKIAKVLGVTVEYLVTGRDPKTGKSRPPLPPHLRSLMDTVEKLSPKGQRLAVKLVRALKDKEEGK
ncbi:helix-turn-helix domain-containing protein [Leadbettera azotonutricia]|uniref:Putative DNA-binding protein n=1 Tax=Leadbettera azotonutricia (strain ATCC BAA-888 / DSM 13862 / ZAS-9) TaxID=545695 RepID=F5YDN8_LEAAZ|nr:helix-turn-helix transcriptional regulator [Leadbettera azotonutricia]AEF81435.1 putative DNA-binding protein [Leadbettera azotonutricia ZAS-9]